MGDSTNFWQITSVIAIPNNTAMRNQRKQSVTQMNVSLKKKSIQMRNRKDGSAGKSSCCYSKGLGLSSQHLFFGYFFFVIFFARFWI